MLTNIYNYALFTGPYKDDSELVHNAVSLYYDLNPGCDKLDFVDLYRAIVNAIIKGVI